jgi:UDP-N-acetylmuramoyl-L-alanyl-D-glutamate--2,6-diaminopimelate ligase
MEIVVSKPFTVVVDYAHEKLSMEAILRAGSRIRSEGKRLFVLFGAQGGGRDTTKRAAMGKIAGMLADFVFLTADDSYEEKTEKIIEDIAVHVRQEGKKDGETLFLIPDRTMAIEQALQLALPGDVVILAGKGAEQQIYLNGKSVPWDDREVVRNFIKNHDR